MSILLIVAALQTSGSQSQPGNTLAAFYFEIALIAVVLAFVVLVFIRASARRGSRR
jgi:hypothetical protein